MPEAQVFGGKQTGELWRQEVEKIDNPFRYCGEYLDEETGNYYLRARYYDPSIQRFMNEDSYGVEKGAAWLEHLYGYASNNPVIFSDPTGHWSFLKAISNWGSSVGKSLNKNVAQPAAKVLTPVANKVSQASTPVANKLSQATTPVAKKASQVATAAGKAISPKQDQKPSPPKAAPPKVTPAIPPAGTPAAQGTDKNSSPETGGGTLSKVKTAMEVAQAVATVLKPSAVGFKFETSGGLVCAGSSGSVDVLIGPDRAINFYKSGEDQFGLLLGADVSVQFLSVWRANTRSDYAGKYYSAGVSAEKLIGGNASFAISKEPTSAGVRSKAISFGPSFGAGAGVTFGDGNTREWFSVSLDPFQ